MKDTNYMDLFDQRMEHGPFSAAEQIAVLRGLGLDVSEEAADDCVPETAYWPVLEAWGSGTFDFDNKVWTPSSDQVYAFDAEVFDIEGMYLHYFKGLQSISREELTFTDVTQDNSQVNWEEPSGTVAVRFCLNGTRFQYDAQFAGDWLDIHIRKAVNRCLEQLGIEKRFYATDGGQGEIIFFCTEDWARRFETATLCFMS